MRLFILSFLCCAAIAGASALAEESTPKQCTRIEVDHDRGVITFVIDGEPSAFLDSDGLHVLGNVNYGDVLTDTGRDWIETRISKQVEKEAPHD